MKKFISLIICSSLLTVAVGCKIFGNNVGDVTPKTKVKNVVKGPARHMSPVGQKAFLTLLAAIENDVITNSDQLVAVLKSYEEILGGSWVEQFFGRKKMLVKFEYQSPKSLSAKHITVRYNPETASFDADFEELKAETDPILVLNVGEAQASITKSEGEAGSKVLEKAAGVVGELGKVMKPGGVIDINNNTNTSTNSVTNP